MRKLPAVLQGLLLAAVLAVPGQAFAQQPNQLGRIIGGVRVLKADFPPTPVLISLEFRGATIESAYSDSQGRFGFYNLVANEYRVVINDDAYGPVNELVNVNPLTSPVNFVQIILVPRSNPTQESLPSRVQGSNPYLVDSSEYNQHFPKKTLKEFQKGVDADRDGNHQDAIRHYQKALALSPDYYPAHNNLGAAYLGEHKASDAQKEFEAALKLNQNDSQAYFNLANVLLLQRDFERAQVEIEQGLQRRPDSAFGHFLQGLLYTHTGRLQLAEKSLMEALQLDPTMSQGHLQLVNLYMEQKRTSDAIVQLEAYLKAFPDATFAPKARVLLKRLRSEPKAH